MNESNNNAPVAKQINDQESGKKENKLSSFHIFLYIYVVVSMLALLIVACAIATGWVAVCGINLYVANHFAKKYIPGYDVLS